MADENPYASPLYTGNPRVDRGLFPPADDDELEGGGLFRKGKLLVMHKRAKLPDRCIKSNVPTTGRLRRHLAWHPQSLTLLLIVFPLYILMAILVSKKATIHIGLSDAWRRKRRRAMAFSWMIFLFGLTMLFLCLTRASHPTPGWVAFGAFGGLVIMIGGLICVNRYDFLVTAERIDDNFVWLKGVHPNFLADLPEWPYRP